MKGNKIIFGRWEATMIMLNAMATQIILGFPRTMLEVAGSSSWIIVIYVTIIALLLFALIVRLSKGFEGQDILDISHKVAGTAGRVITGSILVLYLLFVISLILREFAEDMKVISLPITPISVVMLFFIAGIITAAYLGIEALVRYSAIIIPVVALGFLVIIAAVAPYYNINNIFPLLGEGVYRIFGEGFLKLSIFSALIALFLFPPFLKTHKNFKAVGYASILLTSFFFFLAVFSYILVYPYPIGKEAFLPLYQLTRLISYGRFFERIESVFVVIWATSAFVYLSFGFFLTIYVFQKTFLLEYYRPLIFPFAIIIFTISLMPPNLMVTMYLTSNYIRKYAFIIAFILPLVILLAANLRRNAGKGRTVKK